MIPLRLRYDSVIILLWLHYDSVMIPLWLWNDQKRSKFHSVYLIPFFDPIRNCNWRVETRTTLISKWAKKCVLLRLTSVGAENCPAYSTEDLIHMYFPLDSSSRLSPFFRILIFYSSTIVVKNIIATYVPTLFLISYAYCFFFICLLLRFTLWSKLIFGTCPSIDFQR